MKIIAKTKDGYLIDATDSEVATIQGLSWVDKRFKYPNPGDEIQIEEIYSTVANLSYDDDVKRLGETIEGLSKLHNWLKIYKEKYKDAAAQLKYQSKD